MTIEASDRNDILTSIEKITLFLDKEGGSHAHDGMRLLSLEHPDLRLKHGEVDILALFESEEGEYSAGWIGGGDFRSLWAEGADGTIIDPWLDERVRAGDKENRMHPLPIVYRKRGHDGPAEIIYQSGYHYDFPDDNEGLHDRYLEWKNSPESHSAKPDRTRFLLGEKGVSPLVEISKWAKAVQTVNHYGVSPMRTRSAVQNKIEKEEPRIVTKEGKEAVERREAAQQAIVDIQKRKPLSIQKMLLTVFLGLAISYGILFLFN